MNKLINKAKNLEKDASGYMCSPDSDCEVEWDEYDAYYKEKGKIHSKLKTIYRGILDLMQVGTNFEMGKKNGKGVLTFLNGEVYDGHFKNDLKHGQGMIKYPSGNFYDGEWVNDVKEG